MQSMTGYGERSIAIANTTIELVVRSLNSKGLDSVFHVPSAIKKELFEWSKVIEQQLKRGRVEVTLFYNNKTAGGFISRSKEQIKASYRALRTLAEELKADSDLLSLAIESVRKDQMPTDFFEKVKEVLQEGFLGALQDCIASRKREGSCLAKMIKGHLRSIEKHLARIQKRIPLRDQVLRKRLEEKIQLREDGTDEDRWAKEVFYYLEKMDIEEEKGRFINHMDFFRETMKEPSPVGKKLGFILQEMAREINTMGAKAQDITLQHNVIAIKQALEQIKEQIANIC